MTASQQARTDAQEATKKLLAGLWEKNLPVLRERLALLEAAADAADAGTLTAELQHEAASTAHKLAGSLGMFGHPKGTELARVLEESFEVERVAKKSGLPAQVAALRSELRV